MDEMAFQSVNYHRVQSEEELVDEDLPPTFVSTRGSDERGKWNHIENLDEFFTRVYQYHQHSGFACMVLSEIFKLLQYVFIVLFSTFLIVCVDYKRLFEDKEPQWASSVRFERLKSMPTGMVVCLIVGSLFWVVKLLHVSAILCKAFRIRSFFINVLHIHDNELQNMQWNDVQKKLIEAQKTHHMCVHKADLTELDIYHRILRHKNYLIAMQNKAVIPCLFRFPFLGHRTFLTQGFKYNLHLILFSGTGAPFETPWKLKEEYRDITLRRELAARLSKRIFLFGLVNLALCPFILIYEILYSFFRYAEMIKRSPDFFGARRWSPYGRLYLRHLNELDHEFQARDDHVLLVDREHRLNKAYEPATKYTNSFTSPLVAVLAKNITFFAGALLSVLLGLSIFDQDVLKVEYILTIMAILGLIIKGCSSFIPDENFVWCPESLLKQVLTFTHYIPDHWKGRAHTSEVREQFSRLFQYKFVYLAEELLSPLLTPLILMLSIKYRAQSIVDFLRNFTVEVTGVGDVCSFAQLDVRRHGNPDWLSGGLTEAEDRSQAENGKTELSLLHFSMKNPAWKPSESGERFISTIREQALKESLTMSGSFPHIQQNASLDPVNDTEDITTFIGQLQYPSLTNFTDNSDQAKNTLMNNSMLYFHQLRDKAIRPDLRTDDNKDAIPSLYPSLRRPWPDYTPANEEEESQKDPEIASSSLDTSKETKF